MISNENKTLARLMFEDEMLTLKKQHPNKSEMELLNILSAPLKVTQICSCIFLSNNIRAASL